MVLLGGCVTGMDAGSAQPQFRVPEGEGAPTSGLGLGLPWSKGDPTAVRDDIIDIARSLLMEGR